MAAVERFAKTRRRDDAGHGPRLHHRHRHFLRGLRRHHAAVGLHDAKGAAEAGGAEHFFQRDQIAADQRADVGIQHRRRRALVLAELAQNLVRQRDISFGKLLTQQLAKPLLMRRIGVGMEQADRDAFDAGVFERADRCRRRVFVERRQHLAGGIEPLVHFQAQIARHQRHRPFEKQIVALRPVAPADLVNIAKPFGRDQPGARAFVLEHGVDRHGRAVHEETRAGDVDIGAFQTIVDAARQIVRRGQRLAAKHLAVVVDGHQIGKRSAYINCDSHEAFH